MPSDLENYYTQVDAAIQQRTRDAMAALEAQKQAANDQLTADANAKYAELSGSVEKASQALLSSQLQPIVVNAEQKTPWALLAVAVFIGYKFFRKG